MRRRVVARPRETVQIQGLFVTFGWVIAAFFPFLALFLDGRGLTESEIGIVIAAMAVTRIVTNPVWGHAADAVLGRRTVLQLGLVGAALGAMLAFAASGVWAIAIATCVLTAFMVGTGPSIDAIALEHLGERQHEYGRLRSWESLSYAAGCLVIGVILEGAGVRWAMLVYAIASLVSFAWTWTVERDRPTHTAAGGRLGTVSAVFREAPRFWLFLVAAFFLWTGFNAAWNFFSLKIAGEGGGPLLVGLGTAAGGLVEVPTMRLSSRLHVRLGLRRVYVVGCLVYATAFLAWGIVSDPTVLSALTVLEGVGFSLLFTTSVVVVGRLLPQSLYSTGNSVAQMVAFGLGPIVGAGVGGFVYEHLGPGWLFGSASVLAVTGGVVAWFALNQRELDRAGAGAEPIVPPSPGETPPA